MPQNSIGIGGHKYVRHCENNNNCHRMIEICSIIIEKKTHRLFQYLDELKQILYNS